MENEPKKWSHSEGERPNTVTVAERSRGSPVYVKLWDPHGNGGEGRYVRRSLKFKVRDEDGDLIEEAVKRAKLYAKEQHLKLAKGRDDLRQGQAPLKLVFGRYMRYRSPHKSEKSRKADERRREMFTRVLLGDTNPHDIGRSEWDRFIQARRSGAIDSRGRSVPSDSRTPVGDRVLESDLKWLHAVFNWATDWKEDGSFLMRENPIRGFVKHHLPKEKNPQRKAISQERHEAMLEAAQNVTMEIRWNGKRNEHESWLPELLMIANGTGRRIGSIVALRVEDLHLERDADHPHGAITWAAENDKEGYTWERVAIDERTREAVERALAKRRRLGRVGDGPLFPRATDPDRPITTSLSSRWYRKAEDHLEDLAPMPKGRTWHGYRAKFARETKHLPDADGAEVGGWKSAETIRRVYDGPDKGTMLRVVMERGELREASG